VDGPSRPLAVLLLDLDHFKAINDRYGHLAGDDCLNAAAACLEDTARQHAGLAARYGGEEFALVIPDTDTAAVRQIAETLRLRIQHTVVESHGQRIALSTSIGIHLIPAGQHTAPEEAIRLADEALYRAKRDGRNCVRHSISAA